MKFEELPLNNNVLDALYDMHFDTCTPVQEKCIPEILKGRDVLGVAQTGTGKTAAYLLPILSKIDSNNYPDNAINCLIMSPTRELAQQIDQAMQGFGYYLQGVSSVAVYGGNDGNRYDQEVKSLRLGADVVIATPGRLISHINMGNIDMSKISFFVLDEADRMLDMGFADDIMSIAKGLPKTCQTIMFSATMPDKINDLARTLLKNPVEIKLAVSKPAEKIKQCAYICYEAQKLKIIEDIFKKGDLKRVIVFCGSKLKVKQVAAALHRMNVNCSEMHSDLEQAQRDEVMLNFKSGQLDVLVATDIVARGIDIDDISMVINYDVPNDAEDYVHRIGRTARADRDGQAITLVAQDDTYLFEQIEKFLEKEVEKIQLPEGVGEAPEYTSGRRPQRRGTKAKSIRRKDRNQTAHKHKPRRQNDQQNETSQTVDASKNNNVSKDSEQLEKQTSRKGRRKNVQPQRNNQVAKQKSENERTDEKSTEQQPKKQSKRRTQNRNENRNNKPRSQQDNNQSNVEGHNKKAIQPNNERQTKKQRTNKKQNKRQKQEVTYQGTRKFEAPKNQQKTESGFTSIIKKPLRWLKSLSKK